MAKKNKTIYCGNNALHPDLVQGKVQLGTRHACMRKGVGKGISMPYDPAYAGPYKPIDTRRVYCGNKDTLPQKYDRVGTLPECLQKGVAVGRVQRAKRE